MTIHRKTNVLLAYVLALTTVLCATFNTAAQADETLILAIHPYLPQNELKKKFTPLAKYLSRETGYSIEIRIGGDYEEHIEYIGNNKVDIAYMGPASYVNMVERYGYKPILAQLEINGKPWFQGNIIALKNSNINQLNDLKGKRIAYGDPKSTMSYIVPHYMLTQAGIYTDQRSTYQFLHSHNNVALAVLSGDFDAGAVKPAVFKKFEAEGLTTIAVTPKISEHLFVTRADMPGPIIRKLRRALLEMNQSKEGLAALKSIKKSMTGLVNAGDSDYENLRQIMQSLESLE